MHDDKVVKKIHISTESSNSVETQSSVNPNQAEIYLMDFHGENKKVIHPMYFLNFVKKFEHLSDSSW